MTRIKLQLQGPDWKAMARLFQELTPYKYAIGFIVFLGLVISAIQPVSVKLSQKVVDELQKGVNPALFRWIPLALIGIFAVNGLAKYFHNTIRRNITEKVILDFRLALFRKYLFLPLSEMDNRRAGEVLSRFQNDLSLISGGMDTLCDILREPFTFIGLMGVAVYCDWRLTLCTLLVAPIVALLFSRTGSAVKRYSMANLDQFSDLMSLSHESLVGSRVIKVFRLEGPLIRKFEAIQARYFHTIGKSIRVQELATPLVEFIGALLMAGVIMYGSYRASLGLLTAGQLIAFIIAVGLAQMPIKKLNNAYLKMKAAEAAAERVYEILDMADVNAPAVFSGAQPLDEFRGTIRYENVGLWYTDKPALRDISFEVKRGECIALVGHSGSGKTSIVNLLPRLYDVSSGRITIDGTDIREIKLDDLRGLISFVTQETFLFNDSILENIRYGRPDASDAEVEWAAEKAHCLDFIRQCPAGFKTLIGDRGMRMSGGERQRIAIARSLLKGAPILVLDEATSSLDSHSEMIVERALNELMEDKTTFLVAHRFSTVRRAKRIFVIEGGEIHEHGSHEELVGLGGIYQGLYQKQASVGLPA